MNKDNAQQFFNTVNNKTVKRYLKYWTALKCADADDVLRRYIFAFCSVHTNWEGNVRGYNALKDLKWVEDKADLKQRLIDARCGMYNGRTENIWNFKNQFYEDTDYYCKEPKNWTAYRNELVTKIKGLGIAKVSFTLEMCFPDTAELSCIDTHGIQLYELTNPNFQTKKGIKLYQDVEKHWLELSKQAESPSYISRCMFWDEKQKQPDSRYWSYVLEE